MTFRVRLTMCRRRDGQKTIQAACLGTDDTVTVDAADAATACAYAVDAAVYHWGEEYDLARDYWFAADAVAVEA